MRLGQRALLLTLWLFTLACLGWYVQRRLIISTDLRDFMPPAQTADQKLLFDEIGEGPGSRLLLLAINGAPAAQLAELSRGLTQTLQHDMHFVQVMNGAFDITTLDETLLPYRFLLSPTLDHSHYDAAYLHAELEQRVEDLGSPAATLLKPLLARDPTLELLKLVERWTPPKAPTMREGVWFSPVGEALLLAQTQAAGFDPAAQGMAIDTIEKAFHALPHVGAAQLTVSGPGYFAVSVNARTHAEAEWIGRLSSVGFILLMLFAYRSVSVLALAALPIVSAALVGIAMLTLTFGNAHGITLAFGFTLLGVAQEYPIRLLSHRRTGETALTSARGLWPLLLTAIASACIAYLAFFASGVSGLQQLAVFTISGLLVAGFSTRYLLPRVLPEHFRDAADAPGLAHVWRWLENLPRPFWVPVLLSLLATCLLWFAPAPFWQDDLAALTPIPPQQLVREGQLRAALGAPDVRYLLILRAASANDVLRLSERIAPRLDQLVAIGALDGIELPSRYLPSIEVQKVRQATLPDRSTLEALLAEAQRKLPFRTDLFAPFVADVEIARKLAPLTPQQFRHSPLGARVDAMLSEHAGHWLGLATLIGVHDVAKLTALEDETQGSVRLLDLKSASESLLSTYRTRILWALAIAIILLALTVTIALRNARRVWHVLAPMTLATVLVLAVLRSNGVSLSLFHLVALTLAAGLGLHYALFFERPVRDAAEARRTLHATLVCCASALLVFALLACSTLPVLRAIGLTVSLGVAFHFCLSILMAYERQVPGLAKSDVE